MPALTGLPNTSREIVVRTFYSVSEAMRLLDEDGATTTAGDRGAINIWFDDEGTYQGERFAYMIRASRIKTDDRSELERWLVDELPRIE